MENFVTTSKKAKYSKRRDRDQFAYKLYKELDPQFELKYFDSVGTLTGVSSYQWSTTNCYGGIHGAFSNVDALPAGSTYAIGDVYLFGVLEVDNYTENNHFTASFFVSLFNDRFGRRVSPAAIDIDAIWDEPPRTVSSSPIHQGPFAYPLRNTRFIDRFDTLQSCYKLKRIHQTAWVSGYTEAVGEPLVGTNTVQQRYWKEAFKFKFSYHFNPPLICKTDAAKVLTKNSLGLAHAASVEGEYSLAYNCRVRYHHFK